MAHPVQVIAHRGASAEAPENTLAAFHLAWDIGADAIECDVHLSKDDQLVVIHDDDTLGTTGKPGLVRAQTLEELRELDAGWKKGDAFRGERIPLLAEVLATLPVDGRIFIEIKCGMESIEPLVGELEKVALTPKQTLLMSFNHELMSALRLRLPDYPVGWLFDAPGRSQTPQDIEEVLRLVTGAGVNFLGLSSEWPLEATMIERIHAAGLQAYLWTVDSTTRARELISAGVDGLITNRPREIIAECLPDHE